MKAFRTIAVITFLCCIKARAQVGCPVNPNGPCCGDSCSGPPNIMDPFNATYGNGYLRENDLSIAGSIEPLKLLRTYNSNDRAYVSAFVSMPAPAMPFGSSWSDPGVSLR